jgi:hypothetical protein
VAEGNMILCKAEVYLVLAKVWQSI